MKEKIIIIGAGAAGLSAALELAGKGRECLLVSEVPSERTQSVMAEGGMNAATDKEKDSPAIHAEDTLKAGRNIADPEAVKRLTEAGPEIIDRLFSSGMSFSLNAMGEPDVRPFGGQSQKRTHFAAANTGKQLMHTLIDQTRRYETEGLIERMTGWLFLRLIHKDGISYGCELIHSITEEKKTVYGKVIIASGGLGGMFGNATGTVRNTGYVSASLFSSGVTMSNLEFVQYHPTTVSLHGKNMLITEAVRGEGGRLFTLRDGKPYYFMEDKYPEKGNLMPRDVIAREEWFIIREGGKVYLDMSHLDKKVSMVKLKGVVDDCKQFLGLDPTKEPIPVEPGVHYFMGGICVDADHRTSMKNLYAAGECACQYHGANRLGGNSLLGALHGGAAAADSAIADPTFDSEKVPTLSEEPSYKMEKKNVPGSFVDYKQELNGILQRGLGITRDEKTLQEALSKIDSLIEKAKVSYDDTASEAENRQVLVSALLGKAMLLSAEARKESRGAHTRTDYPGEQEAFQKQSYAEYKDGKYTIYFQKAGERA